MVCFIHGLLYSLVGRFAKYKPTSSMTNNAPDTLSEQVQIKTSQSSFIIAQFYSTCD
jgi:hypothetical protein